jgi:chromosome partitioning protein
MIVVVGGIKGGSGKTTIATNLAVMRSIYGHKTLLVDADEQHSSTIFANQREGSGIETKFTTVQFAGKNLHSQIIRLANDYDDIIIDVGGRDTSSQRSALLVANVFIIPFNPASYDIWTVTEVRNMIREISTVNYKLNCFALINRADPKGSDNEDAREILKECEELKCLDFTIGNRKIFRTSSSDGLSVIEMKPPDIKATQEIQSLHKFIYTEFVESKLTNVQSEYETHTLNVQPQCIAHTPEV